MPPRTAQQPGGRAFWLVGYTFTVVMVGGTVPTPLYPIYQRQIGLSPLVVTLVFAAYAAGVLGALLACGRLSDQLGRRLVMLPALGVAAASAVAFVLAGGLVGLVVGRVLSGVSVGLVTGTATAYLAELHPGGDRARAALVATAVNTGGLGLGPLLSGLLAQYAPAPTVLAYLVLLGLLVPGLALVRVPETLPGGRQPVSWRPQRLSVPARIRTPFGAAAAAGFASFALLGLLSALAPTFLGGSLHETSHAVAGLVVFAVFAAATSAQLLAGRLDVRAGLLSGLLLLPVGLAMIVLALPTVSLTLFVAGAVVGGAGVGLSFKASLALVTGLVSDSHRGEVTSSYFAVAYVGITIPVIGVGVLTSAWSPFAATLVFATLVSLLALAAAAVALRRTTAATGTAETGRPLAGPIRNR